MGCGNSSLSETSSDLSENEQDIETKIKTLKNSN